MAIGATSGILGILFALAQRDLKALLAYSSAENIGIIALALGVGVLAASKGHPAAAAAGFAGALLHVWNHGLFKGLLFLGAGSVAQATHTRDLERLGGLWKRMPTTAASFLVGAAAISGLPPLNGLASEFLVYLGFFRTGTGVTGLTALAALTAAASLALIGGLALACFAKAVGVVFLGEPRSDAARNATEVGGAMRFPMGLLAAVCFAVGAVPWLFVRLLAPAVAELAPSTGAEVQALATWTGPLALVGYVSLGLLALILAILWLRRLLLAGRTVAESPTWDCGYHAPSARMQYTASSFAEPLTTLFRPLLGTRVHGLLPRGYFPVGGDYGTYALDVADTRVWLPLFRASGDLFGRLRFLQRGRVQAYLIYIFVTLVALLVWALAS
jgi:NADH:ubiquinone oxidoreductase subunit 5 (subunit L)/multisubunit Na+/H+ antiporter MnhA subunit